MAGKLDGKKIAFSVDRTVAGADASDYDALVLPGGVANPDVLLTSCPRASRTTCRRSATRSSRSSARASTRRRPAA